MMKHIKKISLAALLLIFIGVGTYLQVQSPRNLFAATIPTPVASFQTSLATGISSTDTTMSLVSITTDDTAVTLVDGTVYGFTVDEGTASEEYVLGTVETSDNTVISMTRGISVVTGNTSIAALKKSHRRGASVKVTDHPTLTVMARIINGNETLPNPISYASGIGPVSSSDLTDKEYVLSVVSGGTITYNQVIVAGTAGETLSAGNLIYLKAADGKWWKSDADLTATIDNVQLGIAQSSGTANNTISGGVLIRGVDTNNTGTAGALVYSSNTAGGLSTSTGTIERVIGQYIISSGGLYFDPNFYYTSTATSKAALAGGSTFGTPSSTNKFLTQDYFNSTSVVRFGGSGADGALNVTSGTTTVDCANANVCVKNYSSINVSSGATLAFSNPASTGTIVILKSTGTVTIVGTVDVRGMGGAASTIGFGMLGTEAVDGQDADGNGGNAGATFSTNRQLYLKSANQLFTRTSYLYAGAGGGDGGGGDAPDSAAGGSGGRGGGGIMIESRGALNFTGTINTSGSNGTNGTNGVTSSGGGGGGAGGSAGSIIVLYNSLTANSGTMTSTGGSGGTGGAGSGGDCSSKCDGGGGAGSFTAAGGVGGGTTVTGSNGAGAGAGAGGGGGNPNGVGSAGGTGGSTESGLVTQNLYLF